MFINPYTVNHWGERNAKSYTIPALFITNMTRVWCIFEGKLWREDGRRVGKRGRSKTHRGIGFVFGRFIICPRHSDLYVRARIQTGFSSIKSETRHAVIKLPGKRLRRWCRPVSRVNKIFFNETTIIPTMIRYRRDTYTVWGYTCGSRSEYVRNTREAKESVLLHFWK